LVVISFYLLRFSGNRDLPILAKITLGSGVFTLYAVGFFFHLFSIIRIGPHRDRWNDGMQLSSFEG